MGKGKYFHIFNIGKQDGMLMEWWVINLTDNTLLVQNLVEKVVDML